jgi:hypothetical protein
MGLSKAQLKRKALNRIASQAAAEKRRKKALGDQHGQEQQGPGADAQHEAAAAAEGDAKENEQQQQSDEWHLHELAAVAAAAAAAAAGVDAAGEEGLGGGGCGLQVSGGDVCGTAALAQCATTAAGALMLSIQSCMSGLGHTTVLHLPLSLSLSIKLSCRAPGA